MGKFLKIIGFIIMLFLLSSSRLSVDLLVAITIVLGVLSAIFMCIGIIICDKKSNRISKQ